MNEIARRWRVLAGGAAAGVAAVVGFAGATASAEPVFPQPPLPIPATVTQTVTVAPDAGATAPQALGQPAVTPGTPALAGISTPTDPAPPPVTIAPAASGTLADFFKAKDELVSKNIVTKAEYQKFSAHVVAKQAPVASK